MAQPLAPLRLACLGPPTIAVGGQDASATARRPRLLALVVYLSLSPRHSSTRDHLADLLWGDKPERKAKHSLNEAIRLLRRALGEGRIHTSKDDVTVSLDDEGLDVDALRFAASCGSEPEQALALLRGEFLEGFYVKQAAEFDDWMTRERQRFHELATTALCAAGERALAAGDAGGCLPLAQQALASAPRSERAMRLLMEAHVVAGNPSAALEAYETLPNPSKALAALAERIRTTKPRPRSLAAEPEPGLVGRAAAHRAILESAATGLEGGPRVILVTGVPGMGRSRILSECDRLCSVRGAHLLRGRCVESDQDARWSALRMLARAGLADAPGLSGAGPESVGMLAALVPGLAERFPPREARDVAEMGAAIGDALGAVAEERPVAVLLDDAHWADGASLAALEVALGGGAASRVTLVLTAAEGVGSPSRELLRLRSQIGRMLPGSVIRLEPLVRDDIGALVRELAGWCKDDGERDRLTRRLVMESNGSPFVAVTLLRGLARSATLRTQTWPPPEQTDAAPWPGGIPPLLRDVVVMQLAELDKDQQAILGAAAVCDGPIDVELLAEVAERPVGEIERAFAGAEERRIVQFVSERYAFVAPLFAEIVRTECLTSGQQRRLERRACDVLATRPDLASRVMCVALLARVGPDAAVARQAMMVARDALATGQRSLARRALGAAERALPPEPELEKDLASLRSEVRAA